MEPILDQFYITGGTLPNSAASYITRQADIDLLDGLLSGEFCYVLNARQMGKSSLMVRTAAQLRARGVTVAQLDVTAIGQNVTPVEWYDGLVTLLSEQLRLRDEMEEFWYANSRLGPMLRFLETVRRVALPAISGRLCLEPGNISSNAGRLVIFVDEIDAVRSLPFSTDEFFGGIRECYNRRANDPALNALTFCLIGVATPADLISDTRMSPFNIGRRVVLHDFTLDETRLLAKGLPGSSGAPGLGAAKPGMHEVGPHSSVGLGKISEQNIAVLNRIFYWAGGHPYLTQRLFKSAVSLPGQVDAKDIDRLCQSMFFSKAARETDDNLMFVRNRLLHSDSDAAALLTMYRRVRAGKKVVYDETNPICSMLELSGVVRLYQGAILGRNRIYDSVFDLEWTRAHMPDAEVQRQRAAFRRGLVRASAIYAVITVLMVSLVGVATRNARLARYAEARATASAEYNRRLAYVFNITGAQQRYADAKITQVLQTLSDTIPSQGEEDLRSFEWGYLRHICHQDLGTVYFPHTINSTSFSPDGRSLACATLGDGIRILQVRDGISAKSQTLFINMQGVRCVAHAPNGASIASGCADNAIRIWDVHSGKCLRTLSGHKEGINSVAFSRDGKILVSASADKTAIIWDVSTAAPLHILRGHSGRGVWSAAISPDGSIVATGGDDGTVRLWSAQTGSLLHILSGHSWYVYTVAFAPRGELLASAGADTKIILWDSQTGRQMQTLRGHSSFIYSLAFSPNGSMLASASWDTTARIWNPISGDEIRRLRGNTVPLFSVAFSPDNRHVATAGGWGSTVKLWDATRETDAHTIYMRSSQSLAFTRDCRRLLTSNGILDADTGEMVVKRPGTDATVRAFSPDETQFACSGAEGVLTIYSALTGDPVTTLHTGIMRIAAIAYSPKGDRIAVQGSLSGLECWSVHNGRRLWAINGLQFMEGIQGLRYSKDGSYLACCDGKQAQIRDAITGRLLKCVGTDCYHACFSLDGRRLATAGAIGTVQVFDLSSGRVVLELKGHAGGVYCVEFSPDGKRLVTGGADNTVRVWEGRIGRELLTLNGHSREVMSVAISPDCRQIASSSYDGSLIIWSGSALTASP